MSKYEEALERARKHYRETPNNVYKAMLEQIFPDIEENEDKKIKEEIINYFRCQSRDEPTRKEIHNRWIAWLEKQGETFTKKDVDDAYLKGISNTKNELEKQYEQKPTDKVEPKFKVGDWITNGVCTIQITSVDDKYYWHNNDCAGGDIESMDKQYHLWTIDDAEDGDVLVFKDEISIYKHDIINCTRPKTTFGGFVYYCCYDGKHFITDSFYSLTEKYKNDIHPATSEQCNLLFSKMKELGYLWDKDIKELKLIKKQKV